MSIADDAETHDSDDELEPSPPATGRPPSEVVREALESQEAVRPPGFKSAWAVELSRVAGSFVRPQTGVSSGLSRYPGALSAILQMQKSFAHMDRAIHPQLGALARAMNPLLGISETLAKAMRTQWMPTLHAVTTALGAIYPSNWGDARPRDWDELKDILAHEGIPLVWVPGPDIVTALFDAKTASERRRVISRRWKGIVTDCEFVLAGIAHEHLADDREFALNCVDALRDGHANAAQALAANLLDSVLRNFFSEQIRKDLTDNQFKKNGVAFDFDDLHFRTALVFAPVWCAHAKYRSERGDRVPSRYGRHPSAHAVGRVQYKRVNAVIALMVVTSVIKFFDGALARRDAAEAQEAG